MGPLGAREIPRSFCPIAESPPTADGPETTRTNGQLGGSRSRASSYWEPMEQNHIKNDADVDSGSPRRMRLCFCGDRRSAPHSGHVSS
jgi:hypothetical protein